MILNYHNYNKIGRIIKIDDKVPCLVYEISSNISSFTETSKLLFYIVVNVEK